MRIPTRLAILATGVLGATGLLVPAATATPNPAQARQAEFTAAAAEYGVPVSVLLAVSYNESLWEDHGGAPSTTGAYGPMGLVYVPGGTPNARGDNGDRPALDTLDPAAKLIGVGPERVRDNETDNIRAGAALLASDARAAGHSVPAGVDGWYPAVARYNGSADTAADDEFADQVFDTIRSGAARTTDDGQSMTLAAAPGVRAGAARTAPRDTRKPECPPGLPCTFVPAAYAQTGPAATDYGNYDLADRPNGGLSIDYIVIHDTEESYDGTVRGFQNPTDQASANYVVQGADGTVTQMVPDRDVAWHAGNWYVNTHSVGIEQVGFAVQGATWFTERLYRTTATLVRYLAARYHVPLDRQHIIGHDNVPGTGPAGIPGMHWDPGPFWNWDHFMALLGAHTPPPAGPGSAVVTINPVFADNIQQVTDCESKQPVAPQAAGFVYLRTAPDATAPLFNDPGLNPNGTVGTTCAADWGDKASAGQQFAVAGRSGDWIAIWWDGAKVWFENPAGNRVATPSSALVIVPRPGLASVSTYGVAYPDPSEYPAAIPPRTVTPLPYSITPGQSYVYGGPTPTDYYYAQTIDNSVPDDHTDVPGRQRYLEIQLGHRVAFVKASDVLIVPSALLGRH